VRINQSILDRLIDDDPGLLSDSPGSPLKSLYQLKQAVRRDMEWILNTRRVPDDIPEKYPETIDSLATYGLPDFTALGSRSATAQEQIRRAIEEAIRRFEPRLTEVSVAVGSIEGGKQVLSFRIEAQLRVDPAPELVVFDTTVDLFSGECAVKGSE